MHTKTQAAILIIALSAFAAYIALALLSTSITVPNSATLRTVGLEAYWDEACTNKVTSIEWGSLEPGQTKSVQIYIKNTGNTPETFSFTTENWEPASASSYITVEWDYDGTQVQPENSISVIFTLYVSPSISDIESFTFDMIITGTS